MPSSLFSPAVAMAIAISACTVAVYIILLEMGQSRLAAGILIRLYIEPLGDN